MTPLEQARRAYAELDADMRSHIIEKGPPWPKHKWRKLWAARAKVEALRKRQPRAFVCVIDERLT